MSEERMLWKDQTGSSVHFEDLSENGENFSFPGNWEDILEHLIFFV